MATWEGAGVESWLSLLSWNIFLGGWTTSEHQLKKHRINEASESVPTTRSAPSSLTENGWSSVAAALGALTGERWPALPLGTVPSDRLPPSLTVIGFSTQPAPACLRPASTLHVSCSLCCRLWGFCFYFFTQLSPCPDLNQTLPLQLLDSQHTLNVPFCHFTFCNNDNNYSS